MINIFKDDVKVDTQTVSGSSLAFCFLSAYPNHFQHILINILSETNDEHSSSSINGYHGLGYLAVASKIIGW